MLVVEGSVTLNRSHSKLFASIDACVNPSDIDEGVCFCDTSPSEARFDLLFDMISCDIILLLSRSTVMLSGNIMSLDSNVLFFDGGVSRLNKEDISEILSTRVR